MTPHFGELIHPVLNYALDLKQRLRNGEKPDLIAEQRILVERLRFDSAVRRMVDYVDDGGNFLGARYALTCWIDELFIVNSSWADEWKEKVLEMDLYGTRARVWKFWEPAEIALRQPRAPLALVSPGLDAVETSFLCARWPG